MLLKSVLSGVHLAAVAGGACFCEEERSNNTGDECRKLCEHFWLFGFVPGVCPPRVRAPSFLLLMLLLSSVTIP